MYMDASDKVFTCSGYQVIRVIQIFAKTCLFEYQNGIIRNEFFVFEKTGFCFSILRY